MKTLVEIINEVETNLTELREAEKKTGKALKALEEERSNIMANIAMFEKVLADLSGTKEKEIEEIMNGGNTPAPAAKKQEEKIHGLIKSKKVVAIDANGEKIAEYSSQSEAARDLGVSQGVLSVRMKKRTKEEQIKSFGFALMFA
jgi:hypothetical protein